MRTFRTSLTLVLTASLISGMTAPALAGEYTSPYTGTTASITDAAEAALARAGITILGFSGDYSTAPALSATIDRSVTADLIPEGFEVDAYELNYLGQGYTYNADRWDCDVFTEGRVYTDARVEMQRTEGLNLRPQTSYWVGGTMPRISPTWVTDRSPSPTSNNFGVALEQAGLRWHNPETFSSVARGEMGSCVQLFAVGRDASGVRGVVTLSEPVFVSLKDIPATPRDGLMSEEGWSFDGNNVTKRTVEPWGGPIQYGGSGEGIVVRDHVLTSSLWASSGLVKDWITPVVEATPEVSLSDLITIKAAGDGVYNLAVAVPQAASTDTAGEVITSSEGATSVRYNVGSWSGDYDVAQIEALGGEYVADDGTVFTLTYEGHTERDVTVTITSSSEASVVPVFISPLDGFGGGISGTVTNIGSISRSVAGTQFVLIANDDHATVEAGKSVEIDVALNDHATYFTTDGSLTPIDRSITSADLREHPANGVLSQVSYQGEGTPPGGTGWGKITYTPVAGFIGTDSFTYALVRDGEETTATVTVEVTAPPVVTPEPPVDPEPPVVTPEPPVVTPEPPVDPEPPVATPPTTPGVPVVTPPVVKTPRSDPPRKSTPIVTPPTEEQTPEGPTFVPPFKADTGLEDDELEITTSLIPVEEYEAASDDSGASTSIAGWVVGVIATVVAAFLALRFRGKRKSRITIGEMAADAESVKADGKPVAGN